MKKTPAKIKTTGSHLLLKALEAAGVDTVFGYPGGAIMPVYDALCDFPHLRHILVRHEQGAVHAAEGFARASGRTGVCIATSGPGATNLITGIADAMIDSVPIVCITGQVAHHLLGTDAFQEAAVIGMVTPITKWCYQITHASEIPEIVAKAFHIASTGRPGPVLIDITKNAQTELISYKKAPPLKLAGYKMAPAPDPRAITRAAALLNSAKRPFILAGHGVLIAEAEKELRALAEKGGFPVGLTLMGLSALPTNHPLNRGMLGMHGRYSTNKLTNQADVILAVGMRFDDRVTGDLASYAKQARIIHIDVDPAELNKNVRAEVAINADAKQALAELIPLIKKGTHADWIREFETYDREEAEQVSIPETHPKAGGITMAEVIRMISQMTKGAAIMLADVGQHQMSAARYSRFAKANTWITSGGLGTMGFALPAAVGAQVAMPKQKVIAVIGDGGFQMTLQELGTIMQEKLPVKILILNNSHLGMVRQWQELFFAERFSHVEMDNPDFPAIAAAYGIRAARASARGGLQQALTKFLSAKGPYLLEVVVKKDENVFPIVPGGASINDIRLS